MKREGRQHGMVRTYRILPSPLNPRPETRFVNKFDSPPTAGLFTKVPSRPTSHSKFTSKCGSGTARCTGCHMHPACKSKDKTKGTQKLKSYDVVANYRLASWRVVDGQPGFKVSGFSATDLLEHLSSTTTTFPDEVYDPINHTVYDNDENGEFDDEGDNMSFCDVGFVVDQVEGDEDWCLVDEI